MYGLNFISQIVIKNMHMKIYMAILAYKKNHQLANLRLPSILIYS